MLCQPGFKRPSSGFGLVIERSATLDASCGKHNAPMRKSFWPSGLRRWLKAPFRKSMASSPTLVVVACDLSPPSPTRSPAAQQQTRMARPIFGSCAGAAGERGALEVQGRSVDACGPVDTASACGAGDRRFESCRSHNGRRCWTHPETLPPRSGTPLDADTHAVPPPPPVAMFDRSRRSGPVAQRIRHRPTESGIAGSSPAGVPTAERGGNILRPCARACRHGKHE